MTNLLQIYEDNFGEPLTINLKTSNATTILTTSYDIVNTTLVIKNDDGTYSITWNNDPDPLDPQATQKARQRVLTQKVLDDSITTRELIEYKRLKIQLGN